MLRRQVGRGSSIGPEQQEQVLKLRKRAHSAEEKAEMKPALLLLLLLRMYCVCMVLLHLGCYKEIIIQKAGHRLHLFTAFVGPFDPIRMQVFE